MENLTVDTLRRLQRYAGALKLVREAQLVVFIAWVIALLAFGFLRWTGHPKGLLAAWVATIAAPVIVAALAVMQGWWRSEAKHFYEDVGRLLTQGNLGPERRRQAKGVIAEFLVQSKLPFVRGSTSEALVIAAHVFGFLLSFALVVFVR